MRILTTVAAIAATLLGAASSFADGDTLGELQRDGLALAERMCAQCHAIGPIGTSANSFAPAFRDLDRRIDLDRFTSQLREGLVSGHPDMPTFRFSREDARALTAYLRVSQH